MLYKKHLIILLLVCVFLYTRLQGIDWGLPYPMHPDERNMSDALQALDCPRGSSIHDCFNPHFYAYGQFPLYVGYAMVSVWHMLRGISIGSISFVEATLALRFISVAASLLNLYFLVRLVQVIRDKKEMNFQSTVVTTLLFTFVPYAIQFSHFGTTESLLMALYTGILYYSVQLLNKSTSDRALYMASLLAGCAVATKFSSLLFLGVPIAAIFHSKSHTKILSIGTFLIFAGLCAAFFSPHNLISFSDFQNAMRYEIGIGQGTVIAFYNRQFDNTVPYLFHATRILPYVLGNIQYIIAILAFVFLPYSKKFNLLRFALLLFFLPTAFFYAKWTRFIAPIFPLMSTLAILGFFSILDRSKKNILYAALIFAMLPGIAYLSIYKNDDVRIKASKWIVTHIPAQSKILSETANVVDVPIYYSSKVPMPSYDMTSFDLYHVDSDLALEERLQNLAPLADYIFMPSRRIFANNTCYRFQEGTPILLDQPLGLLFQGYHPETCARLEEKYPLIKEYYDSLFFGILPFTKVAEISSYPRISLFGKTVYEINDENAEETWTVFDHPVIRIYEKAK